MSRKPPPSRDKRPAATMLPLIALLLLAVAVSGTAGEIDVSIKIPVAVAENSTVKMSCDYDLKKKNLYAVKWYKGGKEFYRFVPKEEPPKFIFQVSSLQVDKDKSDSRSVVLNNVQSNLAGKYKCEVSTDSPDFLTKIQYGYMHVVKLPEGNLTVRVEKPRYSHGDVVRGNCSAPPGNPAANITWTVNEVPVNSSYVRYKTTKNLYDNRTQTIAGLEFELGTDSFINGRLRVTCHADVFHLYTEQATITLEEERPRLASVLGTRESSVAGNKVESANGLIFALLIAHVILGSMR